MEKADKNSVLVVDDERANIIALSHILSPEYTVYAAKNGHDAIETAREFLPDLILLDILMPEIDGYEVFSRLKAIEETHSIPVIFVTGLVETKYEEKGMALGAADYITKPFSPEIVRLRVRNQMQILDQIKMMKQSSIVENSPHFIMYLSPKGELSYVNPAASFLTGHSKTGIMAGGLKLIFSAKTAQAILETHIPETMRNNTAAFEVKIKRKDGETRTMSFTSFTAENGNIGAIGQDVTEIRQLEGELITAKEQAEQSSRAKSEFLSRMSHEMRTPMHAIIGLVHMIKGSGAPAQKEEYIDVIDGASHHLLQLIEDVLDFSSLEKHTLVIDEAKFSFNAMITNEIKNIKTSTNEKKQTVTHNIDALIPDSIIGDEKRLAQTIRNILTNANKFTPERGKINLDASLAGREDGKIILKIEISDNGIGIPKEKQAKIFTFFEQVDGSLSREYEGAGLGLAISKYLVEMMGGRIWVESESGKGAKFTFTARVKNASDKELAHKAQPAFEFSKGQVT